MSGMAVPGVPSAGGDAALYYPPSSGAGWTPLSISNLIGFWRADIGLSNTFSGTYDDYIAIAWADQSPAGNNLANIGGAGASGPRYHATGFNSSYPTLYTDDASGVLMGTSSLTLASTVFSYFVLFDDMGSTSGQHRRCLSILANGSGTDYGGAPSCEIDMGDGALGFTGFGSAYNSTYTPGDPTSVGVICDGTNVHFYINFVLVASQAFSSAIGASPNQFSLNQQCGGSANMYGDAPYALMATSNMTSVVSNLKTWTNTTWGTSF